MTKFENIEDFLGLGKHTLRLEPQDEYVDGAFVKGQQRTGVSKTGNKWWMYSTPDHKNSQGYRFKVLAFDPKQKEMFDSGTVEINIIPGKTFVLDEDGEPVRGEDGKSIRKKKAFFNPAPSTNSLPTTAEVTNAFNATVVDEEININDIPF